jgi:hypothetical protein
MVESLRAHPFADEDAILAEGAAGFEKLAADPRALSAYRAESAEIESGFEASTPEWLGRSLNREMSTGPTPIRREACSSAVGSFCAETRSR